jgi:signal peptidase II
MTRWGVFALLGGVSLLADLASKQLAFSRLGMPGQSRPVTVVPGMLWIETSLNEGAVFGIGQGFGGVFAAISCAAVGFILVLVSRQATRADGRLLVSLGLITGGILGNLYDRLGFPGLRWHAPIDRVGQPVLAVRDWIHFRLEGVIDWPIFNLADSWLVIGACLILIVSLRPLETPTVAADALQAGE